MTGSTCSASVPYGSATQIKSRFTPSFPKDGGRDFAANIVTLGTTENPFLTQINRQALVIAVEQLFGRVQIFGDELAFAKYCQKEWPNENINKVVAGIVRDRELDQR